MDTFYFGQGHGKVVFSLIQHLGCPILDFLLNSFNIKHDRIQRRFDAMGNLADGAAPCFMTVAQDWGGVILDFHQVGIHIMKAGFKRDHRQLPLNINPPFAD